VAGAMPLGHLVSWRLQHRPTLFFLARKYFYHYCFVRAAKYFCSFQKYLMMMLARSMLLDGMVCVA
jgi:hypothetical protein